MSGSDGTRTRDLRRDRPALAEHVAAFEPIYNDERPYEAIAFRLPRERYLQAPIAVEVCV